MSLFGPITYGSLDVFASDICESFRIYLPTLAVSIFLLAVQTGWSFWVSIRSNSEVHILSAQNDFPYLSHKSIMHLHGGDRKHPFSCSNISVFLTVVLTATFLFWWTSLLFLLFPAVYPSLYLLYMLLCNFGKPCRIIISLRTPFFENALCTTVLFVTVSKIPFHYISPILLWSSVSPEISTDSTYFVDWLKWFRWKFTILK